MELEFEEMDFKPNSDLRRMLEDENGDVGKELLKKAHKVAFLAAEDAPKRTGALAASIEVTFIPGRNPSVIIGSSLDYAYLIHEGTPPHEIAAAPGRMLRFVVNGRVVYAQQVNHPGTKANPFLERHLRKVLND
jgi:hypothetical protein